MNNVLISDFANKTVRSGGFLEALSARIKQNCAAAALAVAAGMGIADDAQAMSCPKGTPEREAYVVIDPASGEVILGQDEEAKIDPASMTKMMTLLLAYEAKEDGLFDGKHKTLYFSKQLFSRDDAERYSGWRGGVKIDDALTGMALRSWNDLAVLVAENVAARRGAGASETAFVRLMNQKAQEIGMTNTVFENASGLPSAVIHKDGRGSTVRDMAILLRYIADTHPALLELMGKDTAKVTKTKKVLRNTNSLLFNDELPYEDIAGKTGRTCKAGFALTTYAVKDDTPLIVSYVGAKSAGEREQAVLAILEQAFEKRAAQRALSEIADLHGIQRNKGVDFSNVKGIEEPQL